MSRYISVMWTDLHWTAHSRTHLTVVRLDRQNRHKYFMNVLVELDSPPTSAEVKKMWIYTSTPLYAFTV
jgi:hypothetical protein